MSDMNNKTDANIKNNELVAVNNGEEAIPENLWIIGVSKTHPGLKYYFNTVTGVSLWNISREDMERAKHTMKMQQNQSLYINCPEPNDPPPNKRTSTNKPAQMYCKHMPLHSKNCSKQYLNSELARETLGFTCDVCYSSVNSSPNVITVNFRSSPHPTCSSQIDNVYSTHSQTQSTSTLLDTSSIEKNHSIDPHSFFEIKRPPSKSTAETIFQNPSSEHSPNQSNTDSEFFNQNTSSIETLDLTPLKMFARNGVNKDKWYIIADADVYLHHIKLLKSVLNSDNQCSLMVPQNVRFELDNATKTELRTKAHCASYFIYKMFDLQRALIDEDFSEHIQDKTNEDHVLECCSKLRDRNFYVVVISNDIDLQKYRNKIYIPIFTVSEVKEYLYKSNHCNTTKSPESTLNFSPSGINVKVSPTNSNNKLSDVQGPIRTNSDVKQNKNIGTSEVSNEIGNRSCVVSKTADAEVQTSLHPIQLEAIENIYKNTDWLTQNDDINRKKDLLTSNKQLCEDSIPNNVSGPSKRIKLRRRKMFSQTTTNLSTKLVEPSTNPMEISNSSDSPSNNNLSHNKKLKELNKKVINTNENRKLSEAITQQALEQKIEENYPVTNKSLKPNQGKILESKSYKDNDVHKNVMFEVTTDMMDENLRTRCDEWVSRFVQIMEEALTQVLRKKSSLHLPPPRNMYEAAICVEKITPYDEDVADASKNFLNILNRICDEKGNIKSNISPTQYMEMYSYGVYMVDALEGIFSTCEDLQAASEYLSKLLNDIQNPETDMTYLESLHMSQEENINNTDNNDKVEAPMIVETENITNEKAEDNKYEPNLSKSVTSENVQLPGNNEKFKNLSQFKITITNTKFSNNCTSNESYALKNQNFRATHIDCYNKSQEDNNTIYTEAKKPYNKEAITSPSRYNLRSKQITTSPEKTDREYLPKGNRVIKNDNFKTTFLSNFLLQKNISEETPHSCNDSFGKNTTTENVNDNVDSSGYLETGLGSSYQFNSRTSDLSHETKTSNEPKIVRNFVVCSELEDRLKTRRIHDEMDEFDFEKDLMAADYLDDEVSSGGTGRLQIDEFPECHDNVDGYQQMEQEITKSTEYVKIDFKYFVRKIAEEIKELSSEVYTFSQNCCAVLNSFSTPEDKIHIRERAEEAHLCIDKICSALTKILNRDKNGGYNVQALLKHTEFDDISVDKNQLEVYGSFIARCLEHAHDLKNTVENVLSAVC